MFDDLLEALQQITPSDVRQSTLDEIEDVCRNPVFRLLCDLCDVLHPRSAKKVKK